MIKKYLPLFLKRLKKSGNKLSYHTISEATELDLILVFIEAERRGWIQIKDYISKVHGLPIEEETVLFK